jgi:hypothetical protein
MSRPALLLAMTIGVVGSSCGSEGARDTCFSMDIRYSGSRSGTAYARLQGDPRVWGISSSDSAASIQDVIRAYSSEMFCGTRAVDPGDVPFSADAWIDVTGTEAASCVDVLSASCHPAVGDPQGHSEGVIKFGQSTVVRIDVVDPP